MTVYFGRSAQFATGKIISVMFWLASVSHYIIRVALLEVVYEFIAKSEYCGSVFGTSVQKLNWQKVISLLAKRGWTLYKGREMVRFSNSRAPTPCADHWATPPIWCNSQVKRADLIRYHHRNFSTISENNSRGIKGFFEVVTPVSSVCVMNRGEILNPWWNNI